MISITTEKGPSLLKLFRTVRANDTERLPIPVGKLPALPIESWIVRVGPGEPFFGKVQLLMAVLIAPDLVLKLKVKRFEMLVLMVESSSFLF